MVLGCTIQLLSLYSFHVLCVGKQEAGNYCKIYLIESMSERSWSCRFYLGDTGLQAMVDIQRIFPVNVEFRRVRHGNAFD